MHDQSKCPICGFEGKLEKHHVVPQSKCHSSKYDKKLRNDEGNFLFICQQCHDQLHALFDNNALRDMCGGMPAEDALKVLLADEKFGKYAEWRRKHLNYGFSGSKQSKRR